MKTFSPETNLFTINVKHPCNVLTLDSLQIQDMTITIGTPSTTQDIILRTYEVTVDSTPIDCQGTNVFFDNSITRCDIATPSWLSAEELLAPGGLLTMVQISIADD